MTKDFVRRHVKRIFSQSLWPEVADQYFLRHCATSSPALKWRSIDDVNKSLGLPPSHHLRPYVKFLEQLPSASQAETVVFAAPPQHGKTTVTLNALAYYTATWPGRNHAYITYNQTLSDEKQAEFMRICQLTGLSHKKRGATVDVVDPAGGRPSRIHFTSISGGLTGKTLNGVAIMDDVIKGVDDSDSPRAKQKAWQFYTQVLSTREFGSLHKVCMMTRWDTDDLSGLLIDQGHRYIRLPAICDTDDDPLGRRQGDPLWPAVHPLDKLAERREDAGERVWSAMYQGDPQPDGATVFGPPATYSTLPSGLAYVYGIDLAYTPNRRADWSVAVCLGVDVSRKLAYVVRVIRRQCLYKEFISGLLAFINANPGPIMWEPSALEAKTAGLELQQQIPNMRLKVATRSKYQRSLPTADAWNDHKILVPNAPDQATRQAISNIQLFTGADNGINDDDVDALGSAWLLGSQLIAANKRRSRPGTEPDHERERKRIRGRYSDRGVYV